MMDAMTTSPTRKLIDQQLAANGEHKLDTIVKRQRRAGDSWDTIAYQVRDATGITITGQTLRRWYN